MRIGQIALFYPPVIGGVETFIHDLSARLARRGHEVHVFTLLSRSGRMLGPRLETADGVVIHRVPLWVDASYRMKVWPGLLREISKARPDVLHTYCQGQFHTMAALIASRVLRIPLIVTSYGPLANQSNYGEFENFLLRSYDATVTPLLFRLARFVLARNPIVRPWIARQGLDGAKIAEVPFGIHEFFLERSIPKEVARKKLGLKDGKVALYLGRISEQKGLEYLVKSIPIVRKSYPESIFLFVGPDEGFKSRLVQLASSLQVLDGTRFEGPVVGYEREMEFYSGCDLLVMPSSFEGFGQAVAKAMACGRPVVASRAGSLPLLVKDGISGRLVSFGDPEALGQAIIELFDSSVIAERMGAIARKAVEGMSFEKVVTKMEQIYEASGRW